jgi:hypothetical protein
MTITIAVLIIYGHVTPARQCYTRPLEQGSGLVRVCPAGTL